MPEYVTAIEQRGFAFWRVVCFSKCRHESDEVYDDDSDDRDCRIFGDKPWDQTE